MLQQRAIRSLLSFADTGFSTERFARSAKMALISSFAAASKISRIFLARVRGVSLHGSQSLDFRQFQYSRNGDFSVIAGDFPLPTKFDISESSKSRFSEGFPFS